MFGWAKFWLAAGLTCRPRHPADGRFDRSSGRNTGDDVVCRPIDNGRAGHLPDDSAPRQVASDGGTTPSSDRCSSGAESGGERSDRDFGIVRGGVSQASMAAWSPAEGYVSFRWRAVVNGTSGKNFGGGICGGASGGERALWGAELSYGYAGGRNREQRRRQTGLVFVGTALERPSLAGTCSGAVGVAFGRHLVF